MLNHKQSRTLLPRGVGSSLLAALLFGLTTPLAKLLLTQAHPVLLAALFYLGSGVGLAITYLLQGKTSIREARLARKDLPWLAGALLFGGVLAPLLLMVGLSTTPASTASLLLNLEAVFTVLIAWFIVRENFDGRIALGMLLILLGGGLLSFQGELRTGPSVGSLAIAGACLCWGIDNNFTQKVSASNPIQTAAIKGAVAGIVNLIIALMLGAAAPSAIGIAGALIVGFLGYGVSLVLFLQALRHVGTARTSAYFSIAPFVGAVVSFVLLRESAGLALLGAGALMALGVWLHLTERHQHEHAHEPITHEHRHVHDEHHQHEHPAGIDPGEPHAHLHTHERLTHSHPHYPDIHHRHPH